MCAYLDDARLKAVKNLFPDIVTTKDYREILQNPKIDAVCIATPTNTHYKFSKEALEHNKHVLCEKPLAMTAEECLKLKDLAEKQRKFLMVGHIFIFNPGIVELRNYIKNGELGKVQYAHSERTNLGPFRYDVNALWDLAPHDVAIFNYLFDSCPVNVSARGQKCLGTSLEDLAFVSLEYPGNILVNIHVSWLDPKKIRQITVVGDKKMVVWDDLNSAGPISLYDKHVERTANYYESYGEFQLLSKVGSITIPNIAFSEPLKLQAQYFVDCIERQTPPTLVDAHKGYEVVKVLCAVQRSIDQNGMPVTL